MGNQLAWSFDSSRLDSVNDAITEQHKPMSTTTTDNTPPTSGGELTETDNFLKCSMCKDEFKPQEVTFCVTCELLYCERCLEVLHSLNGHQLISAQGDLEQNKQIGPVEPSDGLVTTGNFRKGCDKHNCIEANKYYVSCPRCMEVMDVIMQRVKSKDSPEELGVTTRRGRMEATWLDRCVACYSLIDDVKREVTETATCLGDVKDHAASHKAEIERAYRAGQKALVSWRQKSLEEVDSRHEKWRLEGEASSAAGLKQKGEELEKIETTLESLFEDPTVTAEVSEQVVKRTEELLSETRKLLKQGKVSRRRLSRAIADDPVNFKLLTLKTNIISRPDLKFTQTSDARLRIAKRGSLIACKKVTPLVDYYALTDGQFQALGCFYWEVDVVIRTDQADARYGFNVGIVQQGSGLYDNPGTSSWYLGMEYQREVFRCWSPENCGAVMAGYQEWSPHTGQRRLGICLNLSKHTLTILDCSENKCIYKAGHIHTGRGLTPAVGLWSNRSRVSMSCRLVAANMARMPGILSESLKP